MKILLINKYHFLKGGAERALFDTARILTDRGHSVAFFSMEHPENKESMWSRFFVSQAEYLENKESLSWSKCLVLATRILWNREAQKKLEALLREFQPDVAHLHNIYHQLSPSILWTLKKHRIPMVMTLHDYKLVSPNYNLFVQGKVWVHSSGWRCIIDACVKDSFSKSFVCALEKWLHAILGSYDLIQQFIGPSRFLIEQMGRMDFGREITQISQPLFPFPAPPVHESAGYLLFYGRLSREKGVEILIEALRTLPEEKLVIIGSGPEEAYLKQKVAEWNLKNVEFLGAKYNEELTGFVKKAKAIIIPSVWYENMPYVLLESLAQGKIVIASRIGGMIERIRDGENGFLFEPGNSADLAKTIQKLENKAASEILEMEASAYESIRDLQPEKYAERLESLYRELTAKE